MSEKQVARGQRPGLFIAALLVCTALFSSTASPAIALPEKFFGMTAHESMNDSEPDWEALQKAGVQRLRMQIKWQTIDQAGNGDWKQEYAWVNTYDRYFEKAAKRGIEILPFLFTRRSGNQQHYWIGEPAYPEWLQFVWTVVQRYGHAGTFWANLKKNNPSVPYLPVKIWEVWNEPNLDANSPAKSADGELYAQFLKGTSETIHAAQNAIEPNPHSTSVLFGGIYQPDQGTDLPTYLQEAKNAGVGIAAHFDGLSIHPYGFGPKGNPATSESARRQSVLDNVFQARNALSNMCAACTGKSLWITEFGWGVGSGAKMVDQDQQSNLLFSTYDWLIGASPTLNIQFAAWFSYKDTYCCGTWDQYSGLRRLDGTLRPSWCAYAAITSAQCFIPYKWHIDNLGGVNTSDADISSWGPGRLDIFARGSDGALWHRYWNYGSWGPWEKMPGPSIVGGPGAVSWDYGRIDVVARTNDANNTLTHWYWNGATWAYDNLGGVNTSDPDISSWSGNRLDVFARGSDGKLWHRYWNYGSWGPWGSRGGPTIVGGPGAVSWNPNRIDVVARTNDANNTLTHWYWNGATWAYDNLGGVNTSDPDIASTGPNDLEIFARGSDGMIWQKTWNGFGWGSWTILGGPVVGGPGAVSWDEGVAWDGERIDVIARSTDVNSSLTHWYWLP